MVTIVTVIGNPEHAVDCADRASNTGTDRAANYRADRTRRATAFAGAFVRAADNALCMPELGHREQCEHNRRDGKIEFHRQTGRRHRRPDSGLVHLDSSICGSDRAGAGFCNADVTKKLLRRGKSRDPADHEKISAGLPAETAPAPCSGPTAH
jgi:hypothetical protein